MVGHEFSVKSHFPADDHARLDDRIYVKSQTRGVRVVSSKNGTAKSIFPRSEEQTQTMEKWLSLICIYVDVKTVSLCCRSQEHLLLSSLQVFISSKQSKQFKCEIFIGYVVHHFVSKHLTPWEFNCGSAYSSNLLSLSTSLQFLFMALQIASIK